MRTTPNILVHSPREGEAERYRQLISARVPDAQVCISRTECEAQMAIKQADILVGWFFPPSIFKMANKLKWIHKVSAGVEDIAFLPDIDPGVPITRTDGSLIAPRMVEYVIGAIFAITQRFHLAWRQQTERRWEPYEVGLARGKTVGVAGVGDIGSAIGSALQANGMHASGWRRRRATSPGFDALYAGGEELEAFVASCDFVVIVLPATPHTRRLFGARVLGKMKPTAWLINVGRGSVVDEAALAAAVASRSIAGAVLDVFEEEPLPASSRLWELDNVWITPHVSGPIVPEDVVSCFIDNLQRFRRGRPLERAVDRTFGY
jgi:glyoxylate/hydroxypyruvate reductase